MRFQTVRQYDLVLFGATGYTGKLCAEHIAKTLPTNLTWAISGRSAAKLSACVEELKPLNSDRSDPAIEICALTATDLDSLAKKTKILINTVGPYHRYSSPVVEACAKHGTHYLDVTGESPWVFEMIKKHHETAKANHAIIIPEIGIESAPPDLLVWLLAKTVREKLSAGLRTVIASSELKALPSGGTLATILSVFNHYSLKEVADSAKPWVFSPIPGPKPQRSASLLSKIFGVRSVPELGLLSTALAGSADEAIVQRSWGLLDGGRLYGPNFTFNEYQRVRNRAFGVAAHLLINFSSFVLAFPPLLWLLTKFVTAPGQGPSRESCEKDSLELRAIATADQDVVEPKRAFARFRWDGGIYNLSGVFLAEAAMVILQDNDLTKKLGGGILTPATLGQPFIDRLKAAGCTFEAGIMPDRRKID